MARGLSVEEKFFRRLESLALSALPIRELTAATEADQHHDGVMVALVPDDPESLSVEDDNALPVDDLHVTLCYLGKVQDLSSFDKTKILFDTRRVCDEIGHAFSTSADGVIIMGQNDKGIPATALLVQSEDIVELYDALSDALNFKSKYPSFIPHLTTGYGVPAEEAEKKVGQQVNFSTVIVKFGDDTHVIPLTTSLVAAPRGANVIDRVIDSLGRLWDEALHPRDGEGKFIKKNGAISGKLAVPNRDRKGIKMVDANRASVVGFHTFGEDVWVLAEITHADGTKEQGFARATDVRSVAPVKARLDALYPIDEYGDAFIDSSLERQRQLDLLLAHITSVFGPDNDEEGAIAFLETLGLTDRDLDYVYGDDTDVEFLGGIRRVDRDLTDDEVDEQEDIINDARTVKELRDRVHGLRETAETGIKSVKDLMSKYDELGVSSFVSERDGSITLSKVVVREKSQGTGSAFMQDLVEYADSVNKRVELSPSSDFGGSKSRLIEFYKRFGFVENKGKNRDFEVSETMYRLPQAPSEQDTPSLEPHVQPAQKLLSAEAPDPDVIDALEGGADPFSLSTNNLLGAMQETGRFERVVPQGGTGISYIEWYLDPSDPTGSNVKLAGASRSTTDRAYFVKRSVIGAELGNTDIVNEVATSLMAENVAEAVEADDRHLLKIPRSVFGDNPTWDGENPPGTGDPFDMQAVHQPGHVISQHVGYLIPADWEVTDIASEEVSFRNDIRNLDEASQRDQTLAFHEDLGDLYGHDIAKMILWDFVILNGDRNPGNAILAVAPDGTGSAVLPIDHGFAFDEPFASGDSARSFDWFMQQGFTQGWRDYVRGGLRLGDNVTKESLRETVKDFVGAHSSISPQEILSRLRAMPGVTDEQIERIEQALAGVVDRVNWMGQNIDAILRALTGESDPLM